MENEKRKQADTFANQLTALAAKDSLRGFHIPAFAGDEASAGNAVDVSDSHSNDGPPLRNAAFGNSQEITSNNGPSKSKNASPSDRDAPLATSAQEDLQPQVSEPVGASFEKRKARANRLGVKMGKLTELSQRAKGGDRAAGEEIQLILDGDADLWQSLGDVGSATDAILFEALSLSMQAIQDSVRRQVEAMKLSLLSSDPSELERMSVQRVLQCWLFMQLLDRSCVNAVQQNARTSELGKLQESAEKRYHTALRNLKFVKQYYKPKFRSQSDADMTVITTNGNIDELRISDEMGACSLGQRDHSADASHCGQTERQKNSAIEKEEVKVGELHEPRIAIAS